MRRSEARLKVLAALKIDAARGAEATGLTVKDISRVSGYRGRHRTLRGVVKRLLGAGCVCVVYDGRPRKYAITSGGQRLAGSYRAAGEAYAETFYAVTRKERTDRAGRDGDIAADG